MHVSIYVVRKIHTRLIVPTVLNSAELSLEFSSYLTSISGTLELTKV